MGVAAAQLSIIYSQMVFLNATYIYICHKIVVLEMPGTFSCLFKNNPFEEIVRTFSKYTELLLLQIFQKKKFSILNLFKL